MKKLNERLVYLNAIQDALILLRRAVSESELNGDLPESKAVLYIETLNQIETDMDLSIPG